MAKTPAAARAHAAVSGGYSQRDEEEDEARLEKLNPEAAAVLRGEVIPPKSPTIPKLGLGVAAAAPGGAVLSSNKNSVPPPESEPKASARGLPSVRGLFRRRGQTGDSSASPRRDRDRSNSAEPRQQQKQVAGVEWPPPLAPSAAKATDAPQESGNTTERTERLSDRSSEREGPGRLLSARGAKPKQPAAREEEELDARSAALRQAAKDRYDNMTPRSGSKAAQVASISKMMEDEMTYTL